MLLQITIDFTSSMRSSGYDTWCRDRIEHERSRPRASLFSRLFWEFSAPLIAEVTPSSPMRPLLTQPGKIASNHFSRIDSPMQLQMNCYGRMPMPMVAQLSRTWGTTHLAIG